MARLQHVSSKVWVEIPDEDVELFGSEWSAGDARSESPDASWKVGELREYAETNDIDLGEATKKADILAVLNS